MRNYILFIYRFILILFCVSFLSSCNSLPETKFPDLFIGKWNLDYPDANGYEIWSKVNDTLYNGLNFADKNTLFETMLLHKVGDEWSLIVKGHTVGNEDIVKFDLTEKDKKSYTFENTSNDFPQQIIYKFRNKKSLVVILKNKNKLHEIYFVKSN